MSVLPVPVTDFVEKCEQACAGALPFAVAAKALPQLASYVEGSFGSLERFSWGIIWSGTVKQLLANGFKQIRAQRQSLVALEQSLKQGDKVALQSACERFVSQAEALSQSWQALYQIDSNSELFSPYPVLDKLLKAVDNVRRGYIKGEPLALFLPPALAFMLMLEASVKRFTLFYGPNELSDQAIAVTNTMKLGIGAVDEYLRHKRQSSLVDCLGLLAKPSRVMFELAKVLSKYAARCSSHAKHPLAEELARAQIAHLSGQDVDFLWRAVSSALQVEINQAQYVLSHPLRALCNVDEAQLRAVAAAVGKSVNSAVKLELAEVDVKLLDEQLSAFSALLRQYQSSLDAEYALAQGATVFEDLLLLVGLALLGQAPAPVISDSVNDILESLNQLRQEVIARVDEGQNARLAELLEQQEAGLVRLVEGEKSGSSQMLREGWQMTSVVLPELKQLSDDMYAQLGGTRQSAKQITCLRCGHSNGATSKYCTSCNAVLLQAAPTDQQYSDITSEDDCESGVSLTNIRRLEALVESVEQGQADGKLVQSVVGGLLELAQNLQEVFAKQVLSVPGSDARCQLLSDYQDNLNSFTEGLVLMYQYAEVPNMGYLYNGLQQCQVSAAELLRLSEQAKAGW